MILLEVEPTLTDLHELIEIVPKYPITVRQLTNLTAQKHSPKAVIDFYKTFPQDEIFEDKDDLIARTENVEIMHHQTAPQEDMHTPEED
jgi:hypothetical protein